MSCVRRLRLGLALMVVATLLIALDAHASDGGKETPIVVRVKEGGFRWSDAGVGALAGVGLSVSVAGCLALVRLRGAGTTRQTKGEQP